MLTRGRRQPSLRGFRWRRRQGLAAVDAMQATFGVRGPATRTVHASPPRVRVALGQWLSPCEDCFAARSMRLRVIRATMKSVQNQMMAARNRA